MRAWHSASGLLLGGLLVGTGVARACGLDGVPSMLVDGRVVAANATTPTRAQVATWAPFVARGVYPAGRPLLLQEIRGRVLQTLPLSAFTHPWRWSFGDGAAARGLRARHAYRRAGTYVVTVQAYLIDGKDSQWFPFDAVMIRVR